MSRDTPYFSQRQKPCQNNGASLHITMLIENMNPRKIDKINPSELLEGLYKKSGFEQIK